MSSRSRHSGGWCSGKSAGSYGAMMGPLSKIQRGICWFAAGAIAIGVIVQANSNGMGETYASAYPPPKNPRPSDREAIAGFLQISSGSGVGDLAKSPDLSPGGRSRWPRAAAAQRRWLRMTGRVRCAHRGPGSRKSNRPANHRAVRPRAYRPLRLCGSAALREGRTLPKDRDAL